MSAQEFRPGDRVRYKGGTGPGFLIGEDITGDQGAVWSGALDLISRPVYPEPGQVAVLLDEADIIALDDKNWAARSAAKLRIYDRAREAIRAV